MCYGFVLLKTVIYFYSLGYILSLWLSDIDLVCMCVCVAKRTGLHKIKYTTRMTTTEAKKKNQHYEIKFLVHFSHRTVRHPHRTGNKGKKWQKFWLFPPSLNFVFSLYTLETREYHNRSLTWFDRTSIVNRPQ